MQVTLEKIAVLDPVFDTFDAVGAYEEVGDPVPGEAKIMVWMQVYCGLYIYIQYVYTYVYMDYAIYQSVCTCNVDVHAVLTIMYVMYCTN